MIFETIKCQKQVLIRQQISPFNRTSANSTRKTIFVLLCIFLPVCLSQVPSLVASRRFLLKLQLYLTNPSPIVALFCFASQHVPGLIVSASYLILFRLPSGTSSVLTYKHAPTPTHYNVSLVEVMVVVSVRFGQTIAKEQ